jgi:hypothetical protein
MRGVNSNIAAGGKILSTSVVKMSSSGQERQQKKRHSTKMKTDTEHNKATELF